jgi:chemotaxis protein methyltransferase CheR
METPLFRKFCRIASQRAGIEISEGKEALVTARVGKRQRALGIATPRQYLRYLESDDTGSELVSFLDVISTKFTSFFREPDHFQLLTQRVVKVVTKGRQRIRLWSAACASGEEPYSMAIAVSDALRIRGHQAELDLKILATDIAPSAISRAQAGIYACQRVQTLSRGQLIRHFIRHGRRGSGSEVHEVKPELRRMIVLKRLNLAQTPFPMRGPLDAVLCRNVMMYLGQTVRQALIDEITRLLAPGGLLMIGHAETLAGIDHRLVMTRPSVFRKPEPGEPLPRRLQHR